MATLANQSLLSTNVSFETYQSVILQNSIVPGTVSITHTMPAWNNKLFRVISLSETEVKAEDSRTSEGSAPDRFLVHALEHDNSVYIDDYIGGEVKPVDSNFHPTRTYYPAPVSSATILEAAKTLPDGTILPSIDVRVEAIEGGRAVQGFKAWAT